MARIRVLRAVLDELDHAVVGHLDAVGRDELGVLEDPRDLVVEAVVLPAEPVLDLLGLGQRAPDLVARGVDGDLDAERLVHAHAG